VVYLVYYNTYVRKNKEKTRQTLRTLVQPVELGGQIKSLKFNNIIGQSLGGQTKTALSLEKGCFFDYGNAEL
jgi:hypothetical protein